MNVLNISNQNPFLIKLCLKANVAHVLTSELPNIILVFLPINIPVVEELSKTLD